MPKKEKKGKKSWPKNSSEEFLQLSMRELVGKKKMKMEEKSKV